MILPLAVTALVAAAMLYFAWRSRAQFLLFPELVLGPASTNEDHVVIIPARNEAAVIQDVVRSLAGSKVVVVDDHSTDETIALATDAGAHVIEADALPKLWLGKPNACWTGAQRTESKWLLFVDADTWFEPGFVAALLAYADSNGLEAATCFPRQIYGTWIERVLMPYAFGLYFTGVNASDVNNPLKREALANGQCLLVRRDAYNFIGGHRVVATSLIEDLALARRLKQHRMKSHVLRADSLASVRMYDSFASLRRGFEKSRFRSLQANPRTGTTVVIASIVMTAWLPLVGWLAYEEIWGPAIGFALLPVVAWTRWYGGLFRALAAPIAIYLFQLVVLCGMFKSIFGLSTLWKGRRVG